MQNFKRSCWNAGNIGLLAVKEDKSHPRSAFFEPRPILTSSAESSKNPSDIQPTCAGILVQVFRNSATAFCNRGGNAQLFILVSLVTIRPYVK